MTSGKKLEASVKKSCEKQGLWVYRLRDNAASFYQSNQLRFTSTNMCDYIIFNGHKLLCLELKNHKGKSLPLSTIRDNQVGMLAEHRYENVMCGFLINLEDIERAFYLSIDRYLEFTMLEDRKSIPLAYLEEAAIEVPMTKLKSNYAYDIKRIFDKIR